MDNLLQEYNKSIINVSQLKKKVKKKLAKYEANQKAAKQKPTHEEQEDGWITVHHRGGRDPSKKHAAKSRRKAKKSEKLLNFYAFEVKESKLKKHKELLEKFEEDKRRLAKMRDQRKFKL